jgi:coenzyme F420-0 gamma-glutamyl ligase (EC 6.3.2.-)
MQGEIRILPLHGIGEVRPGDDLVAILATAIDAAGGLETGDILVVTQRSSRRLKVV